MPPSDDDQHQAERHQWQLVCKPVLERLEKKIDKITYWMDGNGQQGVKVRLDRIEQRHKVLIWAAGLIGAAVAAAGAAAVLG